MLCKPHKDKLSYIFSFALQAISQYCRYYHQTKPFSHIAIDLYKDVVEKHLPPAVPLRSNKPKMESFKHIDEHRSDTDSGRSSAHGDKEIISLNGKECPPKSLRVTRCTDDALKARPKIEPPKFVCVDDDRPIGKIEPLASGRLQVIRRKDAILKRRNMHRRNTIDVNLFDMKQATAIDFESKMKINGSTSTNCINRLSEEEFNKRINRVNGSSLPGR